MKVLDLGCSDGTTALPAARLRADVLGVHIARNLVEAGNEDQLCLLAAAGGLCQSDDLGRREQCDRAIRVSGGSRREDRVLQGHDLHIAPPDRGVCR